MKECPWGKGVHVLVFEPGALLRQEALSADERGSCSVKNKRFVQNMRGHRSQAGRVALAEWHQQSSGSTPGFLTWLFQPWGEEGSGWRGMCALNSHKTWELGHLPKGV